MPTALCPLPSLTPHRPTGQIRWPKRIHCWIKLGGNVSAGEGEHPLREATPTRIAIRSWPIRRSGYFRSRMAQARSLCRSVRRFPRRAGVCLEDLRSALRQQQILGRGQRRRAPGRGPGLCRPHRAPSGWTDRCGASAIVRTRRDDLRFLALRAGARAQARPAPTRRALPSNTVAQRGQNWKPIRGRSSTPIDMLEWTGVSRTLVTRRTTRRHLKRTHQFSDTIIAIDAIQLILLLVY